MPVGRLDLNSLIMNNSDDNINGDPTPLEHLLLQTRVIRSVLEEAEPALADCGLEPKVLFLLSLLDDHPSPAALARAMVLPRPTATSLIKRAEAAGHLIRSSVPGDLRRYHLELTPEGREALARGSAAVDAVVGARLALLDGHERRVLASALVKLLRSDEPPE